MITIDNPLGLPSARRTVLHRKLEAWVRKRSDGPVSGQELGDRIRDCERLLAGSKTDRRKYPIVSNPALHLERMQQEQKSMESMMITMTSPAGAVRREYFCALVGADFDVTDLQLRRDIDRVRDPSTRPYRCYCLHKGEPPTDRALQAIRATLYRICPGVKRSRDTVERGTPRQPLRGIEYQKTKLNGSEGPLNTFDDVVIRYFDLDLIKGLPNRSGILQQACKFANQTLRRKDQIQPDRIPEAIRILNAIAFTIVNREALDLGHIALSACQTMIRNADRIQSLLASGPLPGCEFIVTDPIGGSGYWVVPSDAATAEFLEAIE